jgi:lipid A ethanolaminephosphotransferase
MRPFRSVLGVFKSGFRRSVSGNSFIVAVAMANAAIYHRPLYSFAAANLAFSSSGGVLTIVTLVFLSIIATTLGLGLFALVSLRLVKPLCMLGALCSALALYFIDTYGVVLDKSMIGNVFNTDFNEVRAVLHVKILGYVLFFGVAPCWLLSRFSIQPVPFLKRGAFVLVSVLILVGWMYAASTTWLWIDQYPRKLGGLTLPWSYIIGAFRIASDLRTASRQPILLPPAWILRHGKTIVVLVIGESARAKNFSLYGYQRDTNPWTTAAGMTPLAHTRACAMYTTAALRYILSPGESGWNPSLRQEPLPSYLQRNGVDVIWRTNNWGEPPIAVRTYQRAEDIPGACQGDSCRYDQVLLHGLDARIRASPQERILVVLHLHGSHGPSYASQYPREFEFFSPVCKSVVLQQCTPESLINTYDNSIRYTDALLAQVIGILKDFSPTATTLMYISDHGDSLGEYGLYLHGSPYAIAPDVQIDVPFLVWMSPEFEQQNALTTPHLLQQTEHSQANIFHSIMGSLGMRSDIYEARRDIFSILAP